MDKNNKEIKLNSFNFTESSVYSGLIIENIVEEKYIKNVLKLDDLDKLKYPINKVFINNRRDKEDIYIRLYFDAKNKLCEWNLGTIIGSYLDLYGTFFKRLLCMATGVSHFDDKLPSFQVYDCFSYQNFSVWVVCDTEKIDISDEESIIGYYIRDEDISNDQDGNFVFKTKELASEYLLKYINALKVEFVEGGKVLNFREIFNFTNEEFKFLLEECYYENDVMFRSELNKERNLNG